MKSDSSAILPSTLSVERSVKIASPRAASFSFGDTSSKMHSRAALLHSFFDQSLAFMKQSRERTTKLKVSEARASARATPVDRALPHGRVPDIYCQESRRNEIFIARLCKAPFSSVGATNRFRMHKSPHISLLRSY